MNVQIPYITMDALSRVLTEATDTGIIAAQDARTIMASAEKERDCMIKKSAATKAANILRERCSEIINAIAAHARHKIAVRGRKAQETAKIAHIEESRRHSAAIADIAAQAHRELDKSRHELQAIEAKLSDCDPGSERAAALNKNRNEVINTRQGIKSMRHTRMTAETVTHLDNQKAITEALNAEIARCSEECKNTMTVRAAMRGQLNRTPDSALTTMHTMLSDALEAMATQSISTKEKGGQA